jgi:multicomponent Na+:H+ antiporter subunit B
VNTLIFRTMVGPIVTIMLMFSVFICLRGHNAPGGGFIGGLIGACAIAVLGIASGPDAARKALRVDPIVIAGFGVAIAALSGLASLLTGSPFMTSIWAYWPLGETTVPLSTPLVFDIGVYCVVFGTISAIALALEEEA